MPHTASEDVAAQRKETPSEIIENLHLSVVRGSVKNVKNCLKAGVYVDERLKGAWSPLMFACSLGHAEIVDLLLQYGSNPNFHKGHFTPLMAACTSGKAEKRLLECVKLVVYGGADVNARDLHQHTATMYAAKQGHAQVTEYLARQGADVGATDKQGRTALFWAINNGNTDVVRVLLKAGALKSFTGNDFFPSSLRSIAAKKMWDFFPNDTNNNKLSCQQNGKIPKNKKIPVFFETNEALLEGKNSNVNEIILKESLSKMEELKRRFYQQYAAVYYLRLRLDSMPRTKQPVPQVAAARKLASTAGEALSAAECVYHNLRFLHNSMVQLSESEDVQTVESPTEAENKSRERWSSAMVTIGIVVITLMKTKLFGLLGT